MIIKDPFCYLVDNNGGNVKHVADCASVCYGNDKAANPDRLYANLIAKNHRSMLRHASYYYVIPCDDLPSFRSQEFNLRKFPKGFGCDYHVDYDLKTIYLVVNGHFKYNNEELMLSYEDYLAEAIDFEQHEEARELVRFTLHIGASIATIREFNRVSPNNIAERSTRFCDYNKDKFGGKVTICTPYFSPLVMSIVHMDSVDDATFITELEKLKEASTSEEDKGEYRFLIEFLCSVKDQIRAYYRFKDASNEVKRLLLPLITYSEVRYTYTVKEWRNIVNLRYYGVTGKPNPDARYLGGLVKYAIEQQGYTFEAPEDI